MSSKESNDSTVLSGAASKRQRYEALVKDYYQDIYRYAYWISKSRALAQDLTQETFMRAWRAFDSLQSPGAAKAWLFTILRRENARLYERFQPEFDDIEDYESALPDTRHAEPDRLMENHLLYKAMLRLEPEYREPLLMQVIGGFSGEEIAAMLNLNNNTVMTRLFRARNKLRALLDDTLPAKEQDGEQDDHAT
ncbi:MAG: sigma-70 family RNA polymerase sigma factor [Pseudomonadales bacterium]|jgi:RNA polymerase sigma-70 factor (ECF subfamily)|nr:sigma-70 family RNA polymerase sigma factor [Pseudomonadales bacterium]